MVGMRMGNTHTEQRGISRVAKATYLGEWHVFTGCSRDGPAYVENQTFALRL